MKTPQPSTTANKAYTDRVSRRSVLLSLAGLGTVGLAGGAVAWLTHRHITTPRTIIHHPKPTPTPTPPPTPTPVPIGTILRPYYGHFGYIYTVSWSPDSADIVSGSEDHTVHLWDAKTGADVLFTYSRHTDAVRAVAWSPDGTMIASGSMDSTVQIWKTSDESSVYTFTGHTDKVRTVAWSPDSTMIASGSVDKTVHVWKAATGEIVATYTNHTSTV